VDLAALARQSEGRSGADIEAICRRATMFAIEEYLEAHPWESDPGFRNYALKMAHLVEALKALAKEGAR
jgi:transitional endoplasmic reticulum ATPase